MALVNQRVVYDLLFQAASETLLALGRDPKHLGAEIGMIAVLHTWGQNLLDHPHLHCIVPGGGVSDNGQHWRTPKQATKHKDFFIHVNVLSELFKQKFLAYLKHAYQAGELTCVGKLEALGELRVFQRLLDELYRMHWVTYCKPPFGGPDHVLTYLARYTHRVAISNNRLVNVEDGNVTFTWRDYRDGNTIKEMTVEAGECIRRFVLLGAAQEFLQDPLLWSSEQPEPEEAQTVQGYFRSHHGSRVARRSPTTLGRPSV